MCIRDRDGIFGSATERAVRAFQQFYGLTVDGLVGKLTWNKIYEVYTGCLLYTSRCV